MPSIFDGIDAIVNNASSHYRLPYYGRNYSNWTYYTRFTGLAQQDEAAAVSLVSRIISETCNNIVAVVTSPDKKRAAVAGHRGVLRQVHHLSQELRTALANGGNLESVLERTIIYVQTVVPNENVTWYNQFNVASGILGNDADGRTAVDLVRRTKQNPRVLEFIELKEWDSGNHPFHAALEILRYYCAIAILSKGDRKDPNYLRGYWPNFEVAKLFVLAPDSWYQKYDNDNANLTLDIFKRAVDSLVPEIECLKYCSFSDVGLRLSGIDKETFRGFLRSTDPENNNYSFLNLTPESAGLIADWVNRAFLSA
jgi:hypothetical protein